VFRARVFFYLSDDFPHLSDVSSHTSVSEKNTRARAIAPSASRATRGVRGGLVRQGGERTRSVASGRWRARAIAAIKAGDA
jgi:hypothetical protein